LTELYRVPLGTSARKEGAVVVVGTAGKKGKEKPEQPRQNIVNSENLRKKGTVIHSGRTALRREQCNS
jgi:hypothetical protein